MSQNSSRDHGACPRGAITGQLRAEPTTASFDDGASVACRGESGLRADFAPIAALLLFAAIIAGAVGGLHYVQTLREQARRAQCAGGLKQLQISLTSKIASANGGLRAIIDTEADLSAPPLIESCLAELEADDA
jgi:hypothetical protein